MKNKHFLLLVALCVGFVTVSNAQRRKPHGTVNIKNGFALGGGITQYDIYTDNFETTKGEGWMASMSATVDLPHKAFNVSYGMQLAENHIGIATTPTVLNLENSIDYKIFTAQVAFLWHIKLGTDYVTFDVGPMLQYNSDLELKDKSLKDNLENTFIAGFNNVSGKDIMDINNVNANVAVGLTAGISHFKVRAQYIYGLTNMFGSLNKQDFAVNVKEKFKGNQGMLALTAMISF